MLIKVVNSLFFALPVIAMLSGLSVSLVFPLLIASLWLLIRKDVIYSAIFNYKPELLFLLWLIISCFWSSNVPSGLLTLAKIFIVVIPTMVLIGNIDKFTLFQDKIEKAIAIGSIVAIVVFHIQRLTSGALFNLYYSQSAQKGFHLYSLDRGCAFLAVTSWLVIFSLVRRGESMKAFIYYVLVLVTLYYSDSDASLLGFLTASLGALLVKYTILGRPRIFCGLFVFSCFIFIVATMGLSFKDIAINFGDKLPTSYVHRLFIWDFVAHKIMQNPIIGYGFNASRSFILATNDIINFKGSLLSPLPLHPHNNLLQLLLETGVIGLLLFFAVLVKWLLLLEEATKTNKILKYSVFINYFVIGMISYNMWQSWWVYSSAWVIFLLSLSSKGSKA